EDGFYLTGTTMSYNAIATPNAYQSELPDGNNPTNSFLIKFKQKRMGVEDSKHQKLSLWPNPTEDQFTVEGNNFGEMQISIFDLMGREVFTQNEVKIGQPIHLRGQLSSGIYIVKLKAKNHRLNTIKLSVK
ncbi:MAG: T9SS type A sorting domain-containing protein, partial [Flavobacteriaceae bacterium]